MVCCADHERTLPRMSDPSQSFGKINYEVADHVATITLDDPETRNSLSDQLLSELIAALNMARDDYAVRVVVLASSHEKVFSAGGNLAAFGSDSGPVEKFTGAELFVDCFKLLGELGKQALKFNLGVAPDAEVACDVTLCGLRVLRYEVEQGFARDERLIFRGTAVTLLPAHVDSSSFFFLAGDLRAGLAAFLAAGFGGSP
jgi:hypothetical protein